MNNNGTSRQPLDLCDGSVHKTNNYGLLEIVKYHNAHKVLVRFLDTGFEVLAEAGNIRKGRVKDLLLPSTYGVGFFGVGQHEYGTSKKENPAYMHWRAMMQRCYSPYRLNINTSYINCYVCDDWHNFQVFATWYCDNHPNDGISYQLDKDIKFDGNKIYSPETCMFVTKGENIKKSREKMQNKAIVISPDGELYFVVSHTDFAAENGLHRGHLSSVIRGDRPHHKGWKLAGKIK